MNIAGRAILVVEDEIIVAFALEDMLLDMGASVEIASTIDQGLAALTESAPDLAILDVNVHGVKSYALAAELRGRAVPVIFATGYGDAEHPADFATTPTMAKPYTQAQLQLAVENLP